MEELLALYGSKIKSFKKGEIIDTKLTSVQKRKAFFDVGGKSEGVVTDEEFDTARAYIRSLKVGDTIQAEIVEPEAKDGLVHLSLARFAEEAVWLELEKALKNDTEVTVYGRAVTEKGIIIEYNSLSGFVPLTQLGKEVLKDTQSLIDKPFKVKPLEIDRAKERIVFSERAVSEGEEIKLQKQALDSFKPGDKYKGKVTQLTSFGAFIELKADLKGKKIPVEGLVHISELSWDKVGKPQEVLEEGDEVEVIVIESEEGKLALSIKQAQSDPWNTIAEKYAVDQKVKGTVLRKSNFGAFVVLESGVEGLIHLTKIPPGTDLKRGQEVNCYIESIDARERKIALGLVLTAKPIGYK
ncbi:hypothetical protein A2382_02340 [Candidatus Woesebacteria bacterium RIFOXYB1_FULL_38_16]|uniref:S1 motif domain-containing protein n=1 Tax=Candidatus Woesebacteria bacterium RIFOXYB1_FULL_38_16 TaxID=1802538 RepID=A0A1F8CSZ7_9BACT|nr:MAG: hypothetical protein A2191_04505 [Candidatus Woesebacteria bacterium RIFOXYA1_FULL_38_9]OGM78868.1 MAG: hypothetical protein A2382_02340 [Candidatus Woesebacteria bacterium RIFOXYB1_FULL_38_16]